MSPGSRIPDPGDYCRQLEAYLCRKNDGHLIRIVGPAFDAVCGWMARGIPLKLAMQGIDRYVDRYYAKGPRRRPVRIEFCEADVLDVFDEWRRSVGVATVSIGDEGVEDETAASGRSGVGSLPSHLERVIARLTTLRAGEDRSLDSLLDETVRELDAMRGRAKSARGDARDDVLDRLRRLDGALIEALRTRSAPDALQALAREADEELQPFRRRLAPDAYQQASRACVDRLLRERAHLPTLTYE